MDKAVFFWVVWLLAMVLVRAPLRERPAWVQRLARDNMSREEFRSFLATVFAPAQRVLTSAIVPYQE
jgi:hypothetical protein